MKWIITLLAVMQFGFMAFDGMRALTLGDYIRPQTGSHAGQLGPWHRVAIAAGIDPEGTPMKGIFVFLGAAGLVAAAAYAAGRKRGRRALMILNVLSLWYLVIGTVTAVAQLILLAAKKEKSRGQV